MAVWSKEQLQKIVEAEFADAILVVASNREPYLHVLKEGKLTCQKPAGGVVSALDPVMKACGGIWVAHGSGNADKKFVDEYGKLRVPPDDPKYTLKRIWLTKEQEAGYYYGFSNESLWPLCHIAYTRPNFEAEDWDYYKQVNELFAKAILEEIKDKKAFVWIQDYHTATLPKCLKSERPDITIAHFWHIPWPNPEAFRICPWRKEILEGLLCNDLLGFHIRYHCDNFIETVEKELEAKIDREKTSVIYKGHQTLVRAFPISVDFQFLSEMGGSADVEMVARQIRDEFALNSYEHILLGMDRIDYTKGIPERLMAIDRFLKRNPQYLEKFLFIQIGVLSRIHLSKYKALNDQINSLVEEINWKYSSDSWSPILLLRKHLPFNHILAFYRLADLCIVSSIHDGMNLVAKEFVSTRSDLGGMLMLSQFTGSSRELDSAVLINPYDTSDFADKIKLALEMPEKEREKRMVEMRGVVSEQNVYRWAAKVIQALVKL